MKTTIFTSLAIMFISAAAMAESPVYGTGTAYNMCNGMNFESTCKPQLIEEAKQKAIRDMAFVCHGRGGAIVSNPNCSTICTPSFMSPDQADTMVSCSSDCSAYCQN